MTPFTTVSCVPASLPDANLDTDIIFPARFLLLTEKVGLGRYAFYEKRYHPDGSENAEFVLNQTAYRDTKILIAGDNFGSGSSREQAPWALNDLGIRCVISSSFGEIFFSNCCKNGMLPVVVTPAELALLHADAVAAQPVTVDLVTRSVLRAHGAPIGFDIADWRRDALLHGWDDIAIIHNQEATNIAAFEARQRQQMPWLYPSQLAKL